MTPTAKFVGPLAGLSPAAKKRLEALQMEIEVDRVTVSFSIATDYSKRNSFVSISAKRGAAGALDGPDEMPGWALGDIKCVVLILVKQVVARAYECAAAETILTPEQALQEKVHILISLDRELAQALGRATTEG